MFSTAQSTAIPSHSSGLVIARGYGRREHCTLFTPGQSEILQLLYTVYVQMDFSASGFEIGKLLSIMVRAWRSSNSCGLCGSLSSPCSNLDRPHLLLPGLILGTRTLYRDTVSSIWCGPCQTSQKYNIRRSALRCIKVILMSIQVGVLTLKTI